MALRPVVLPQLRWHKKVITQPLDVYTRQRRHSYFRYDISRTHRLYQQN